MATGCKTAHVAPGTRAPGHEKITSGFRAAALAAPVTCELSAWDPQPAPPRAAKTHQLRLSLGRRPPVPRRDHQTQQLDLAVIVAGREVARVPLPHRVEEALE